MRSTASSPDGSRRASLTSPSPISSARPGHHQARQAHADLVPPRRNQRGHDRAARLDHDPRERRIRAIAQLPEGNRLTGLAPRRRLGLRGKRDRRDAGHQLRQPFDQELLGDEPSAGARRGAGSSAIVWPATVTRGWFWTHSPVRLLTPSVARAPGRPRALQQRGEPLGGHLGAAVIDHHARQAAHTHRRRTLQLVAVDPRSGGRARQGREQPRAQQEKTCGSSSHHH